jgi:hypothetical protein
VPNSHRPDRWRGAPEVGHTRSVYRWANRTDLLPRGPGETKGTDYNSNLAWSHRSRKRPVTQV